MRLFGNKGVITPDEPNQNEVIARVELTGKGVKVLLIRCIDSETIYKAAYVTSKSDVFAFNVAIEALEKYAEYEGLEIISKSTNIDLPYVKKSSKRMR